MNYKRRPDIDSDRDLTVDALGLFQRFQQEADLKTVDRLLESELSRHIKLCELAILYAAKCTYYWCRLPEHAIQDVSTWAYIHLEEMGFKIEHHGVATRKIVSVQEDSKETVTATVVDFYSTAKWFLATPIKKAAVSAEWCRSEKLEEADLVTNPPQRQSRGSGKKLIPGGAVWAAILDRKFIVEVQRLHHRSYLCIFDLAGKFIHLERTSVSYGAIFGPDACNVAEWQKRASKVVADRRTVRQSKAAI